MPRSCATCGKPIEQAFDIPWLGKFYRCEDGHAEVREPEGGRSAPDESIADQFYSCKAYVHRFVQDKNARSLRRR
jgi:hypothetical protein